MHLLSSIIEIQCEECGEVTSAKARGGEMNLRSVHGYDPAWLVYYPEQGVDHADPRTKRRGIHRKQTVLCPTCLASPPS